MADINCTTQAVVDATTASILVSFFGAAVVTIIAVLLSYITKSLDDDLLNQLDRRILGQVETLPWKDGTDAKLQLRKTAVTNFIMALSDQQLVTGLAILVAGISGQSHLSGYEFNIVLSLAWFSSTTHLATLDVLRKEFQHQGILREFRVGAMLGLLGLLVYTLAVSLIITDDTIPVQCFLDGIDSSSQSSPFYPGLLVSLAYVLSIFATVLALVLLVWSYFVRLQNLYSDTRNATWLLSKIWTATRRLRPKSDPTRDDTFEEHIAAGRVRKILRFRRLSVIAPGTNAMSRARRLARWRIGVSYSYGNSFLSTVPSIVFSFSYGVAQIVVYRWTTAPILSKESLEWGFGQIVALFIMCLPFLSAGEAYYDYHKEAHERKSEERESLTRQLALTGLLIATFPTFGGEHAEYELHRNDIKMYFPAKVSPADLSINDKRSVLDKYLTLKSMEEEMYDMPIWPIFITDVVVSALLGVFLNSTKLWENIAGAVLFFAKFIIGVSEGLKDMRGGLRTDRFDYEEFKGYK